MAEKISIVVPCYNEEPALPPYYKAMAEEMLSFNKKYKDVEFEIILVNDGSKDKTLEYMRRIAAADKRFSYISFSRNFGKEAALLAGLKESTGDYVAVMDADLQDPPSLLEEMYRGIKEEGYDCVGTRRVTREGEPKLRSFFARLFYKIINKMSDTEIVDGARDYRLIKRDMVNAILSMPEKNRFSKGLFSWVGFKTKWLEYVNVERVAGETSWSFWKLFKYSIEGFLGFTTMPLILPIVFGVITNVASVLTIVIAAIINAAQGYSVSGVTWFITISLFTASLILLSIGIVGMYFTKMYSEIKNRPVYIVAERGGCACTQSKD